MDVVSIQYPFPASAVKVEAVTIVCQDIAANPVAVPRFENVAPDGTVKVSPLSPNVNAVPVAGEILLVFTSSTTVNPAQVGTVTVSPEVPISNAVPDCGSILSTSIFDIRRLPPFL